MAGILLDDITVQFKGSPLPVLTSVSLELRAGQITAVLGPSGCGKSTLLRIIAGLLKPTTGTVQFRSPDASVSQVSPATGPPGQPPQGALGYVFQESALLPWRSVLANATLPMELLGLYTAEQRRSRAAEQLEAVGLKADDFRKVPAELSGGMRMRVSIARALVTNPSILLLDEPFAALDDILRSRLGDMVVELWRQHPRTVVLVTHNIAEAILLSQRIIVMGKGCIAADLAVEIDKSCEEPRATEAFSRLYAHVSSILRSAAGEETIVRA